MYEIPQETYYVMDMLDHSMYHGSQFSLDKIATEVYGRKYRGQQTGDMISNDTTHVYDMSSEDEVLEWLANDGDYFEMKESYGYLNEEKTSFGLVPGIEEKSGTLSLRSWIDEPVRIDYDGHEDTTYHERLGPTPQVMLAHLIHDGHLPYGKYLLNVSW